MNKEYSVAVWDIQLYKIDEEGDAMTDKKGNVQLYTMLDYDCSYLADGLDVDELEEIQL